MIFKNPQTAYYHHCMGALISSVYVLTSAVCFFLVSAFFDSLISSPIKDCVELLKEKSLKDIQFGIGHVELDKIYFNKKLNAKIIELYKHPKHSQYNEQNEKPYFRHNLGLLKLGNDFDLKSLTGVLSPACLLSIIKN